MPGEKIQDDRKEFDRCFIHHRQRTNESKLHTQDSIKNCVLSLVGECTVMTERVLILLGRHDND
jgi:hypothetical protein